MQNARTRWALGAWSMLLPFGTGHGGAYEPEIPSLDVAVPALEITAPELRDAPADDPCERLDGAVDSLQESVLEIQARYWASRMREPGFSVARLTRNPGSEIFSRELRSRFYALLRTLYAAGTSAPAEPQLAVMLRTERRISALVERCQTVTALISPSNGTDALPPGEGVGNSPPLRGGEFSVGGAESRQAWE